MATAYVDWDASWTAVTYSTGTDWTSVAMTNGADLTSDAMSLDTKVCCQVSVQAVEDNTGACTGNLYVYLCRDLDGTNYEDYTSSTDNDNPPLLGIIVGEQNKTRSKVFNISSCDASSFKIAIFNDSDQEQAITVKVRYAVSTGA